MMDWILQNWFVEAVVIIAGSFLIGLIVGKAIKCVNGDD
jgi:hypothetical protein